MSEQKECNTCKQMLPIDSYGVLASSKSGYRASCRVCRNPGAKVCIVDRWSEVDKATVRTLYPLGGVGACVAALDGRKEGAVNALARRLGVKFIGEKVPADPWGLAEYARAHRQWQVLGKGVPVYEAAGFGMGRIAE